MRIGQQSARRYITDDVIRELARELALAIAEEQPGADVLEGPRTVPVVLSTIGRTIAALAEAAHVRAQNKDYVGVQGALQVISVLGQIVSERDTTRSAHVLLPQAALTRGARMLETTARMVEAGGQVPPDMSADTRAGIASAFARDAATLRILVADHGTMSGPTALS
jgi:hypothetical protein